MGRLNTDLSPLLTSFDLGPARIKNRIFVAPHTTNFGAAGRNLVTERHLDYHRERARGGAGLIITEGIRVHPTSLRRLGIHAYDDEALAGLTALADVVHAEDTRLFAQLLHTGRHSGDEHQGSWGAGPAPWSTGAHSPHVMNAYDLDAVIAGFAAAAARVVEAGFDGMEVHLGHGHLLQQFLSPLTNDRRDGYGGSFEARARLAREVLVAVVDAVAGRAAVGLRLSADEFLPGGLGPDDVVRIVAHLREVAPVDFLHVSHSAYVGAASLSTQMADMSYGRAPFRHLPARFKREFPDVPVLAICRIDTLATGASMVAAGEADLVGFARAHIAEPALTRRTLALTGTSNAQASAANAQAAGTSARDGGADGPGLVRRAPRHCIACNQGCNANLEAITPITCTVNPAVGDERAWATAEAAHPSPRSVLVVGAGPAGLEAAITAARRGHRVVLADAADAPGGSLPDVARIRPGFALLLDDLLTELDTSDVIRRFGAEVTAATVAALSPDVVVLATGATTHPADALTLLSGPLHAPSGMQPDDTPRRCTPRIVAGDTSAQHGDATFIARSAAPLGDARVAGNGPPVLELRDVVRDPESAGAVTLVLDELGSWEAFALAEYLAARGTTVRLVSPLASMAPRITVYSRLGLAERLRAAGVRVFTMHRPTAADGDAVTITHTVDGSAQTLTGIDSIVHVRPARARAGLLDELAAEGWTGEVHLVGDAFAPRTVQEAVYEGRAVGLLIGAPTLTEGPAMRPPYALVAA
ncbi:oxidoreductase [Paractinoplanes lichenicola]|uniref:FAD-dependent oxidoreductase n=1 Tax=Paractinoplanes lichenicola TaxID=2802976 RepID=A0ABS1VF34_9ACTN|nr:FAD-dependent oxidoreductase [Actinoplanes lichenicola]MBL7253307.1 FAD-dependent oxidoreductase [Actinoplanes lichenicola]